MRLEWVPNDDFDGVEFRLKITNAERSRVGISWRFERTVLCDHGDPGLGDWLRDFMNMAEILEEQDACRPSRS